MFAVDANARVARRAGLTRRRCSGRLLAVLVACAGISHVAAGAVAPQPSPPPAAVAQRACDAIAAHAGAPVGPPEFLQSYVFENDDGEPALNTAAFTYDNALAVIALIGCHRLPQALRVGEALRAAALAGPRLRNAYRAGPVKGEPLPNGWWDAKAKRWQEDRYQLGTATGNVAWAGLALLALDNATGERRWRDAAAQLAHWIVDHTAGAAGAPGFTGGVDGFDADPVKLAWESTEHNIDAAALFAWLARDGTPGQWQQPAESALRFVDSQWDAASGHFLIGTLPDGHENTTGSAIDVQMWALLLPGARPEWRRDIDYAETHYAVPGGFDFNSDRDGLWLEGTAQAALAFRSLGLDAKADNLLRTVAEQFSASGYVYATREPRITTGLALGPNSTRADFYYYRRPHLAATAWAALAALEWNPFVPHGRHAK